MLVVNGNEATADQYRDILGLQPNEIAKVLGLRTFSSVFDFRRALPFRVARTVHGLDFDKLDINSSPLDEFVNAGVPASLAEQVVAHRPYFSMSAVRSVPGVTAETFGVLDSFFAPQPLNYTAKLTGKRVQLTPDPSQVVVTLRQTESTGGPPLSSHGFTEIFKGGKSEFRVFSVPQSEGEEDPLDNLRQNPGVDRVIPAFVDSSGRRRYIDPSCCTVQFAPETSLDRQNAIVAEAGLVVSQRFRSNSLAILKTPQKTDHPAVILGAIARLNGFPEVKLAEPCYIGFDDVEVMLPLHPLADLDVESVDSVDWNLQLSHIPDIWPSGKGSSNVVIVVVDSGVDETHPALRRGLFARADGDNWNFADPSSPGPKDDLGHGTFIAGVLLGRSENDANGICPGCRVMALKVPLEGDSSAYASRADAILYALDRVPADHRIVFNLSWKTTGDVAVVHSAIQEAVARRGAIVVTSAGNEPDGPDEPHYPSDYPETMSVAAVDPDRRRASYSYFGSHVDLSAPGGDASENPLRNIQSCAIGGGTQFGAGTSYAAPHVAGLAALILSQKPDSSVTGVRNAIESTASPLADSGMGHGLIDAAAAIASATGRNSGGTTPQSSSADDAISVINRGDASTLVARFALMLITARLIVAKRPIGSLTEIRGVLGLTDEQFNALNQSETQ
jgi:hypothetical protein